MRALSAQVGAGNRSVVPEQAPVSVCVRACVKCVRVRVCLCLHSYMLVHISPDVSAPAADSLNQYARRNPQAQAACL